MGLALDEVYEKKFKKLLDSKEISAKQFVRALIKQAVQEHEKQKSYTLEQVVAVVLKALTDKPKDVRKYLNDNL